VERNKEGDGFARLRWEETKEGDTVGGARLTLEIGAEFPIGIMDQGFQQAVEVALDPFAQHEAVVAREPTRVVARPEDQVVRLGDYDQFLVFFHGLFQTRWYNLLKQWFNPMICPQHPKHHAENQSFIDKPGNERPPNWQSPISRAEPGFAG
jgi:hypothetical protein